MMHCMLDLETLGTTPGCVILSIGAVVFDPYDGMQMGNKFHCNLDPLEQIQAGLVVDPATEAWWSKQSVAAKSALHIPTRIGVHRALPKFSTFLEENEVTNVWGHGAGFDQPILRAVYVRLGLEIIPALRFYNDLDTRTIFNVSNVTVDRNAGTHHRSIDDAIAQAKAVCEAYVALGITERRQDTAVIAGWKAFWSSFGIKGCK